MNPETYPFQISVWQPALPGSRLSREGYWKEMGRATTEDKAREVALCMGLRHPAVALARLQGGQWANMAYYPSEDSARQYVREHP